MKDRMRRLMLAVGACGVALGVFLLMMKLIPLLIALVVIIAAAAAAFALMKGKA